MFKGAASTHVDCLLKFLSNQKEKVESQNKDIKAKSLAKQKAKECLKTVSESFKDVRAKKIILKSGMIKNNCSLARLLCKSTVIK